MAHGFGAGHHRAETHRGGLAVERGTVPRSTKEFSDYGVQPGPGFALHLDASLPASGAELLYGKDAERIRRRGGGGAHRGNPAASAGNRSGSAPSSRGRRRRQEALLRYDDRTGFGLFGRGDWTDRRQHGRHRVPGGKRTIARGENKAYRRKALS